jgi:hypothetical protein
MNKNIVKEIILTSLLLFTFLVTWIYYPIAQGHGGDFIAMLSNRENASIYWDGKGFGYGPMFALYDFFLRGYNDETAMQIMYFSNLLMLIFTIFILLKCFLPSPNSKIEIIIALFLWVLFYPTFQALRQNNVEITEIFFLSIMLLSLKFNKSAVAGIALGFATSTKILPGILILYFFWRMKLKVVFFSLFTIIIIIFYVGFLKNENINDMLLNFITTMSKPWPNSSQANQALSGFVWREFSQFDFSNRVSIEEPKIIDIKLAKIYTLVLTILFLCPIIYTFIKNAGFFPKNKISFKLEIIEIGLILTSLLLVLPHNHVHYFILISWVYIVAIREWRGIKIKYFGDIRRLIIISYLLLGMISFWRILDPLLISLGPITGVDIARLYNIPLYGALLLAFCLIQLHNIYYQN